MGTRLPEVLRSLGAATKQTLGRKRLFVDLTDLVHHARHNHSVTGIQRVQIEIARKLLDHDRKVRAFNSYENFYTDLTAMTRAFRAQTAAGFYTRLRHRFGDPGSPLMPARTNKEHEQYDRVQIKLRNPSARAWSWPLMPFGHGDRIFVGGAFWADPSSLPLYERASEKGAKLVVFIHDLIPLTFPQYVDGGARPHFERLLRLPLKVITNSQFTRLDLLRAAGQVTGSSAVDDVAVVPLAHEYPGVPRNRPAGFVPSARLAADVAPIGEFALCVGTVEIRKNHDLLLKVWIDLAATLGSRLPKLVIAGRRGWMADEAIRLLDAADSSSPFIFLEAPTDEELAWLYGACNLTVFPSLAEGWGLPVGESLWFGKPCLASNAASIPEVGGALCDYADASNSSEFSRAIANLALNKARLYAKANIIRQAPLRTWDMVSNDVASEVEKTDP